MTSLDTIGEDIRSPRALGPILLCSIQCTYHETESSKESPSPLDN